MLEFDDEFFSFRFTRSAHYDFKKKLIIFFKVKNTVQNYSALEILFVLDEYNFSKE